MALKKSQRSLKSWTKQKWRTKSGKKSSVTGERYLPEEVIKVWHLPSMRQHQDSEKEQKGETVSEATEKDCKENKSI